jgi:cobalamin synthase
MVDPAQLMSNPVAAVGLRALLGGYVIVMARKFYADPAGYFRKAARPLAELPWLEPTIRALACFCLWGGCFIVATAVSVQIFGLHGDVLGVALVVVAAIAAWLLLPSPAGAQRAPDSSIQD